MDAWGPRIGKKERLQTDFKDGYAHYLDWGDSFIVKLIKLYT